MKARNITAKTRNIKCEVEQFVLMGHRTEDIGHAIYRSRPCIITSPMAGGGGVQEFFAAAGGGGGGVRAGIFRGGGGRGFEKASPWEF